MKKSEEKLSLKDFELDTFSIDEAKSIVGGTARSFSISALVNDAIDMFLPTIDSYTSPYFSIGDRIAAEKAAAK